MARHGAQRMHEQSMDVARQITRADIESMLSTRQYFKTADNDFQISYARDAQSGRQLTVRVSLEADDAILAIRVNADRVLQYSELDWARAICNEWNQTRFWPKVAVFTSSTSAEGMIVAEFQLPVRGGISASLLEDCYVTAVGTTELFWQWAHETYNL